MMNRPKIVSKNATYVVDYTGPRLSLNQWRSLNWRKLAKQEQAVAWAFIAAMPSIAAPSFKWFELHVSHNTRLDMDNVAGTVKPCVDVLRRRGIIDDDNKENWDYYVVRYDKKIKKNTIRIKLVGEIY